MLGATNPSGKLPVTFPKSIEYAPSFGNFPGDIGTLKVDYKEDVFIGYRHFDRPGKQDGVQFAFGYGLSYTDFEVDRVEATVRGKKQGATFGSGQSLCVSARVKNVGARSESEVV